MVKNSVMLETRHRFSPWVEKIPWRREWQPTPIYMPEEFHGQRSLVNYSPWGHKELDMTKLPHTHTDSRKKWFCFFLYINFRIHLSIFIK